MVPEGGYRPGATLELMIFFGIILTVGIIMMILDYVFRLKKRQNQETPEKKSISAIKLSGLLIAIFGAFGIFLTFLCTL